MSKLRTYPNSRLVALQRRLNTIFVKMRDKGQNIECIYRNLLRVEYELGFRRVYY